MSPYYNDSLVDLYHGDWLEVLTTLPSSSVHTVVTSPPYWGLRDYGVSGQLGLERTPEEYVSNLVAGFREVWRVMRDDGTAWLNLGDCYHSGNRGGYRNDSHRWEGCPLQSQAKGSHLEAVSPNRLPQLGLKDKDLVGIPWRVAFALQADGWYLRSDIIWSKPNPMPESVTDRPTKSHEYLFLLSKAKQYYYDAEAIKEPGTTTRPELLTFGDERPDVGFPGHSNGRRRVKIPGGWDRGPGGHGTIHRGGRTSAEYQEAEVSATRNRRSVWTIATQPFPEAHFATFPPKLVEPCIKAGTSERGCCPECGAPWERVVERAPMETVDGPKSAACREQNRTACSGTMTKPPESKTTDWRPPCSHHADPIPCTVLDPFCGSGTALYVAKELGRRAIGIDLKEDYLRLAVKRVRQQAMFLPA